MIRFLKADTKDASKLTQICQFSKAYWGYHHSFLDQWRDELTITKPYIDQNMVFKILQQSNLVGFFALEVHESYRVLEHLWLLPAYIGNGIGTVTLNFIKNNFVLDRQALHLVADPNAEEFYLKNDFITYDYLDSSIKNRKLPKMKWLKKPIERD